MNPDAWTSKSQLAVRCDFELTSPAGRSRSQTIEGETRSELIQMYREYRDAEVKREAAADERKKKAKM